MCVPSWPAMSDRFAFIIAAACVAAIGGFAACLALLEALFDLTGAIQ